MPPSISQERDEYYPQRSPQPIAAPRPARPPSGRRDGPVRCAALPFWFLLLPFVRHVRDEPVLRSLAVHVHFRHLKNDAEEQRHDIGADHAGDRLQDHDDESPAERDIRLGAYKGGQPNYDWTVSPLNYELEALVKPWTSNSENLPSKKCDEQAELADLLVGMPFLPERASIGFWVVSRRT